MTLMIDIVRSMTANITRIKHNFCIQQNIKELEEKLLYLQNHCKHQSFHSPYNIHNNPSGDYKSIHSSHSSPFHHTKPF